MSPRSRSVLASDEEFEEFVAGALPRLLRFAHVLTGNPAAAEDLVQTALGRSWRAWRLHRIDDPQAFVRKVMVNSYASWYRRHGSRETAVADPPEKMIAEDQARRIDDRDAVWLALLPGLVTHSSGVKPSAVATTRTPSPGSSASSVPSWAKGLHGEVAYKCGNYICLMRPDGTGKRTLTATYPEWDPAWSPDGRM